LLSVLNQSPSPALRTRNESEKLANFILDDFYAALEPSGQFDTIAGLARQSLSYYDNLPPTLRTALVTSEFKPIFSHPKADQVLPFHCAMLLAALPPTTLMPNHPALNIWLNFRKKSASRSASKPHLSRVKSS
jgi:hypothetical protein